MSGPLFDVYRLVYARMLYYVRANGETGEGFPADMGVLIGDPASPIMWLLYFRSLIVVRTPDDVELAGVTLSHLEQADDIVLFALSPTALQAKLDSFYSWCCSVFLRINKLKSWWMPLSSIPRVLPVFKLGGELVPVKDTEFYVGMKLSATRNIFAQHSQYKADTAFTISSIMFASIDKRCVQCPPVTSCRLYKTIIDPHLTHGCDVSPDATKSSTDGLERTQLIYLRKALRVGKKTTTVALFTETGIAPVRYRRADLLVRFLGYLLQRPRTDLVACALRDSLDLAAAGRASWALDVSRSLQLLPVPVALPAVNYALDIDALREEIKVSLRTHLATALDGAAKLDLLRARPAERAEDIWTWGSAPVTVLRSYLKLKVPDHRTALTRLLLCSHGLAVERLRWDKWPREVRLCRFCEDAVEDAVHALWDCGADEELVALRDGFFDTMENREPAIAAAVAALDGLDMIRFLSTVPAMLPSFARFVHYVLRRFGEVPMFRPQRA
ncbi:hypothetical protein EXIGLDRAFT_623522 [Exidia glandulosa HHB12029]|uniref:Reverse transcriptase domain-containing protein n=1 Tax=Exidia glandulosa HHB12029 TaxID=1314781 RepID=A0A165DP54_EXIGL|nr:hypothetical protein EXIGLDRAFT_623522 [Exidia glandulosa HHB12029]